MARTPFTAACSGSGVNVSCVFFCGFVCASALTAGSPATSMSISFSSADGGLFAANPLRSDRISIKGVNWFGAEGENAAPDGLWERSAAEYLDFAVEHGFNALRLPLAVARGGGGARGVGEGATSSCRGRPTRRSWSTARF